MTGRATEYLRVGDAGSRYSFRFCPVCGSNVFHTEEGQEEKWVAIAVGAFGDPSFPDPEDSVYECRRHAWVSLPERIKRYDKNPSS